jgi:ATP-dependent DNA ligase
MLSLINPVQRAEPFDHANCIFEVKFDGFCAAADTARGRLISRNGNRMQRLETSYVLQHIDLADPQSRRRVQ